MGDTALGAVAVLGAVAGFGSFGVPIRSQRLTDSNVHPVVVQLYKSGVCFATCWLALLAAPFRFTLWGLLAALMWVFTGIAAVIAIQSVGLALSQSLWSGITVFVGFAWGTLVFHEHISNLPLALLGLCVLTSGLVLIGYISSSIVPDHSCDAASGWQKPVAEAGAELERQRLVGTGDSSTSAPAADGHSPGAAVFDAARPPQLQSAALAAPQPPHGSSGGEEVAWRASYWTGMACTVLVGVASGSFMVPMKYANKRVTGLEYIVSFGIGAAVSGAAVAAAYTLAARHWHWRHLDPKWRQAGPPAMLAGLLWSGANFAGIIATQELGLALAWPATQSQLLVSTAWGAFYYKEVHGRNTLAQLIAATAMVILGIVLLAAGKY